MSKRFLDDGEGRVSGVETVLVEWTKVPTFTLRSLNPLQDDSGRWKMAEVPDSEKTYSCQLVLLAMGFLGPEKVKHFHSVLFPAQAVLEELEVKQDPRGNVSTPQGQYATSVEGVFAAGDCRLDGVMKTSM